jgi:hypothetical protein
VYKEAVPGECYRGALYPERDLPQNSPPSMVSDDGPLLEGPYHGNEQNKVSRLHHDEIKWEDLFDTARPYAVKSVRGRAMVGPLLRDFVKAQQDYPNCPQSLAMPNAKRSKTRKQLLRKAVRRERPARLSPAQVDQLKRAAYWQYRADSLPERTEAENIVAYYRHAGYNIKPVRKYVKADKFV